MYKRARLLRLSSLAVLAGLLAAAVGVATGGPLGWWLRGWPLAPGPGAVEPVDQAVLAYQPNGPGLEVVEAEQAAEFAGRAGGGTRDTEPGPPPAGDGQPVAGLGAIGRLTGDLAPQSQAALLMEPFSGQILYVKNEHARRPVASLTKIMTLNVILDAIEAGRAKPTDRVIASEHASGWGGSQIWLEPGESMSLHDLLIAIAVGSANDACVAVAEHLYGTHARFVEAMNEKARELGMANTHFANAHGLDDPAAYSTAYDAALMSQYAVGRPVLLGYTAMWIEYLRDGELIQVNHNKMVRHYPGCDGLKTGWTTSATSGHCISATARRDGTRLIAVILGAPNSKVRFAETTALLNAGFATFRAESLAAAGEVIERVAIERGTAGELDLVPPADFGIVLGKGERPDLKRRIECPARLFAPIQAGQEIAQLIVEADGQEVGRTPLVAARDVRRANPWQLMWKAFAALLRRD